jgi:PEP-CTERM motif
MKILNFASMSAFGALALALAASPAAADTFSSSADFAAATNSLSVEDYGAYTPGQLIADGGTLGALTYTFSTGSGLNGVVTNLYNSFTGNSLAAVQDDGPLDNSDFFYGAESFTVFFPTAVTAVGIFSNINIPATADLSTSSGTASVTTAVYDVSTFGFIGFTSSTPFTSATFTSTSSFNIPEIEYGSANAGIPEPTTWAMMLAGFAGLGAVLRRRATPTIASTPG